jgi:hypothetical protein
MRELARGLPVKTPKRTLVRAAIREQGLAPTGTTWPLVVCGRLPLRPNASGGDVNIRERGLAPTTDEAR